jgi:hypothetical protein
VNELLVETSSKYRFGLLARSHVAIKLLRVGGGKEAGSVSCASSVCFGNWREFSD